MGALEGISTVAVLGAGTMGHGIAQVAAAAGFTTRLFDIDEPRVAAGMARIAANLQVGVDRGKVTPEAREQTLARLRTATDPGIAAQDADLVIEAVPEQLALKHDVLGKAAVTAHPDAILGTNTSSLSIAAIASGLPRPERVIGTHFFNPVHIMKLLEIVVAEGTSPEVVRRIANMEQTNPEVIKEVERGLESRLSNMLSQSMEKAGGINMVAEVLNLADRATEKAIMEGLEAEDPDLVEQIRRLMFVFEDIQKVNDKGIQSVLKEVDNSELALALKTASKELQNKIFKNMSERAAAMIAENMQYMGPVRVSDVEAAQQRIVDIVRRLEDSGDIIISGRGGDSELLV